MIVDAHNQLHLIATDVFGSRLIGDEWNGGGLIQVRPSDPGEIEAAPWPLRRRLCNPAALRCSRPCSVRYACEPPTTDSILQNLQLEPGFSAGAPGSCASQVNLRCKRCLARPSQLSSLITRNKQPCCFSTEPVSFFSAYFSGLFLREISIKLAVSIGR